MAISLLHYAAQPAWDDYILNARRSCCYHLSGWKKIVEQSFGHETYYLLSERRGVLNGVLPLVHLKSMLFGNFFASLPYFNYGGICAEDETTARNLLKSAVLLAREKRAGHIELRHVEETEHGLFEKREKVSMRLELPSTATELWNGFTPKLRSQIKRALKEEQYVEWGCEGQLDAFYKVFSTNMRDLGTPVYSRFFFDAILKAFPQTSWISTVYTKHGDPVASGFFIGFKKTVEIPWASSLRTHNHTGANMLLYWKGLEYACKQGYEVFDFGRSTRGAGTYRFKEQWGARPVPLYWHYWLNDGEELPQLNPQNPKYRMAIRLWKKMPVRLANFLGPTIVKNLP